jgi:precorrin-2 dehydrogenase/sirohydrochlorin ferrochelatase
MSFSYFPFLMKIDGKKLIFIGGGKVAERKVKSLKRMNPKITVIAPEIADGIKELGVEVHERNAEIIDLSGADFAFICTNDRKLNELMANEAKRLGIPVNIADDPDFCDFHMPAVLLNETEGTLISVSTGGDDPSKAKKVRDRLANLLKKGES